MIKETILRIGDDGGLVGILSEPESPAADRPAFLLLNAGILHRVGPARVYVALARALAAAGFYVLRFDVSGLGDSAARTDGLPYSRSRIAEASVAMDALAARGIERFVLFGVCSGADHAFRVACADRRVVGVFMVDGYAYPTWKTAFCYYTRRSLRVESWRNVLTGRHSFWRTIVNKARRRSLAASDGITTGFVVETPPRQDTESQIRALVDNDIRLFLVYTASAGRTYTYRGQFADTFPSLSTNGQLHIDFWPDQEHTFKRLSHHDRLVDAVGGWASTQWPA